MDNCIKIASRASVLAKIQAKLVGERISDKYPNYKIEYHWIKTTGDLDQRLDISSGSTVGVFTSDISQRIISSEFDMAIHSWKDYPIADNGKSKIYGTLERADLRDVLLLKNNLKTLKSKERIQIMTSSPRRRYSLEQNLIELVPIKFNKINFLDLRGNIDTRLKKFINDQNTDGIVIAKAALDRVIHTDMQEAQSLKEIIFKCLKESHWIVLPLSSFPTAPGQGAIGIEVANNNKKTIELVKNINNKPIYANVTEEKLIMSNYGGGCSQKIGVSVWNKNEKMIHSLFGITESNEKLKAFSIVRSTSEQTINTKVKKNDVFPKNKEEQNIFERSDVNKNQMLNKLRSTLIYITRKNVLGNRPVFDASCILWTSGLKSWRAANNLGYWIHGTSDSMGETEIKSVQTFIGENFPITKLTFKNDDIPKVKTIDVYELNNPKFPDDMANRKEFFWMSTLAFKTALEQYPDIIDKQHACGMGNTFKKLKKIITNEEKLDCYLSYESWFNNLQD